MKKKVSILHSVVLLFFQVIQNMHSYKHTGWPSEDNHIYELNNFTKNTAKGTKI